MNPSSRLLIAAAMLSVLLPGAEAADDPDRPRPRIQPHRVQAPATSPQVNDWPRRIAARDPGSQNDLWAKPGLDDRAWKSMKLPVHWESAGLPDYDGVVWFRRTIEIPAAMAAGEAILSLGAIDDMDVTWVNGTRVGGYEKAGAHFTPRNYKLPPGTLKAGTNIVAVRVMDHGAGGGMAETHGKMQLTAAGKTIPLTGGWRYRTGASLAHLLTASAPGGQPSLRPKPFEGKFVLRKNDVVAFAGGTAMAKQMESGHLETILTAATPQPVFFRDIAWQADTVYRRQRPRNFGSQLGLLERIDASVIVANFGQMEALDGATRLPEFIAAYESLLDEFARRTPRLVLVSPHPFEKGSDPHLPDLSARNGDVAAYAEGIRQLAQRRGCLFVDLSKFAPGGLTSDGLQLSPEGHLAWARKVAAQLTGEEISGQASALEDLRKRILHKNDLWHRHWRPTNWSFLYGNRQHVPSSHDHRRGKPRWFPEEVNAIIPLLEQAEEEIQSQRETLR